MKKLYVLLLIQLVIASAYAKDTPLFTIKGKTINGDWTAISRFYSHGKPEVSQYKECLSQRCHGDPMEGDYTCEKCTEYSELKEKIQWSIESETSFYYRDNLQTKSTYPSFFMHQKSQKGVNGIFATNGFIYAQSCKNSDECMRLFVTGNTEKNLLIGNLDRNLNAHFSIIGKRMKGRMNVELKNKSTVILPATFVIEK
jgi:hypothetical protein